jgi:hypothetical protein
MQGFGSADPGHCKGLICCHCENPFSNGKRRCKDPDGDRFRIFNEKCRDCFWPLFTHPEWLCCDTLFGCCRDEDDRLEGIEGDEDPRRHRRCCH